MGRLCFAPVPGSPRQRRIGLALLALLWVAQHLFAATHPWFPDALNEGSNSDYAIRTGRVLAQVVAGAAPPGWFDKLSYQGFPYGPLLYLLSGGLDAFVASSPGARLLPVPLAGLLTLLATFGLGRRVGGPAVGAWAAGAVAALPMFNYYCRHLTTDTLLCAAVTGAAWAAVGSRGYQSAPRTALLGLILGLGALVKPVALNLSLAPLVLYGVHTTVLGRTFPGDAPPRGASPAGRLGRAALPLLLGSVLASAVGWLYLRHLLGGSGHQEMDTSRMLPTSIWGLVPWEAYPRSKQWGSVRWLLFYPTIFFQYQAGIALGGALIGGALLGVWRRRGAALWCSLAVLAGVVFFTGLGTKKWYYTLPLLPLLAVASAHGAEALLAGRSVMVRRGLALALGVLGLAGAWLDAPGLLWNRPPLLQVAPGPRTPSAGEFALAIDGSEELVVLSEQPLKRRHSAEQQIALAFLIKLEVAAVESEAPWTLSPVESRDQLLCRVVTNPHCRPTRFVLWMGPPTSRWPGATTLESWPDWGDADWIDQQTGGGLGGLPGYGDDGALLALGEQFDEVRREHLGRWDAVLLRRR